MRKFAVVFAALFLPTAGVCQEKIENGVRAELNAAPLVRVLIVTRPDPEQANGGASFASASSYVSQALSDSAKNIRAIGSLPVARLKFPLLRCRVLEKIRTSFSSRATSPCRRR